MFFDTHAHFDNMNGPDGAEAVIRRALEAGTSMLTVVGGSAPMNSTALEAAALFPENVLAAVGFDRELARAIIDGTAELQHLLSEIRLACSDNNGRAAVRAVGETGLDYHYCADTSETQVNLFRAQLELAGELGLPVIIHSREADNDTLSCLRDCLSEHSGVMHCFSGGPDFARELLDMGLYISFSGVITFGNAEELRETAKLVPPDRILIETDTPYLAPVPHRGRKNEPAFVRHVAEKLAEIRGWSLEETAQLTSSNARRLFNPNYNGHPPTLC